MNTEVHVHTTTSRKASLTRAAAMVLAAGAAIAITLNYSQSAFTASTSNSGNSLTAGTVGLSSDQSGTSMFNLAGMVPGDSITKCVTLTYTGNLPATKLNPVRVSATDTGTGNLGAYISVDTVQGSEGQTCANAVYTGMSSTTTLSGLVASAPSGFPLPNSWTPSAPNKTMPVKMTMTLNDDNAAQGKSSAPTLTWTITSK